MGLNQDKLKEFIKENFGILLIVIFGFMIRIYYFILTKNQTEFWDGAEYLSYASHWAFGLPVEFNPQRPPL